MEPTVTLISAAPSQASALTRLAIKAKQALGYPPEWVELWKPQLTITEEYLRDNHSTIAVNETAVVLGFCVVTNTGWLEHLWVAPSHQRNGIGTTLLNRARQIQPTPLLLIESDPFAEPFYLKAGAFRIGTSFGQICNVNRELPILVIKQKANY